MMDEVEIMEMLPEHATEVADLHIRGIPTGFISSLGPKFVTALYVAIAKSEHSLGFVAKKDNKVIGFASFTTDLGKLYKSVIFSHGLKFVILVAWKMLSFKAIRKILETLFYPKRIEKTGWPRAEFLSMVIAEQGRGKGLATRLMYSGFKKLHERGIDKLKILAAVDIVAINKLYEKEGFELAGQVESHGILSNIYVAETFKYKERLKNN